MTKRISSTPSESEQLKDLDSWLIFPFLLIVFGLAWSLFALFILGTDWVEATFGELSGSHPLFILAVYAPAIAALLIVGSNAGAAGEVVANEEIALFDGNKVGLNFGVGVLPIGRLAMHERKIYFEYGGAFIKNGLEISPVHLPLKSGVAISLDRVAEQAQEILDGTADDMLQELLALNGSSAGARTKALIGLDSTRQNIVHGMHDLAYGYEPWIVKFSNAQDGADGGAIEYVYALMAKEAGITVPDVHLFPAAHGAGYFTIKRFDRDGQKRFHMYTACGILHSDFRTPSLDYEDLIALTSQLTRDIREVEKMYRLAVFNVLVHNRDDHAKNFSFLMNSEGQWTVSPAYAPTFSSGPRGEQSTMVMGEGQILVLSIY